MAGPGVELDGATHAFRQLPGDREPEPRSRRAGALEPAEPDEDSLLLVGRDALAPIFDPELSAASDDPHDRARRGVQERVVDERPADLEHPFVVGEHDPAVLDPHLQPVVEPARDGGELLAEILSDRPELDGLELEPHRTGIEPGEVEQVGRELREPLDLLGHRLEELASGGLVELLVAEELEKAAERENRRAELV